MYIWKQIINKINRNHSRLKGTSQLEEQCTTGMLVFTIILAISLIVNLIALLITKAFDNQLSSLMNRTTYMSMCFILCCAIPLAIKEKERDRKIESKIFGVEINGNLKYKNAFLNAAIYFLIYFLIPFSTCFFVVYIIKLDYENNLYDDILKFILNSILVLLPLLKFNTPKEIIHQQEFERNFFISLEEIKKNKSLEEMTLFYLSLRLAYKQLYEYQKNSHSDNRKFIIGKYNYIIKSYLDENILYKVFTDNNVRNSTENDYSLFSNIKLIIEKYGLFENINKLNTEQNQFIFNYSLLSYLGSYSIISYIFKKAKEDKSIKIYIKKSLSDYLDYAENEEDHIFYLSLIMYDKNEISLPILNNKINDIEFSNIHSRNLFLMECIAYSICNTQLYEKYIKTVKNVLQKIDHFLYQQLNNKSNDKNTIELIDTFNQCIGNLKHNKNLESVVKEYSVLNHFLLNEDKTTEEKLKEYRKNYFQAA